MEPRRARLRVENVQYTYLGTYAGRRSRGRANCYNIADIPASRSITPPPRCRFCFGPCNSMYRHCLDEAASATTRQSEPTQPAGSKITGEFGGQSHCGIPPQLLPQGGPVTFNLVPAQTAGGYWHKQTHCSLPASISSLYIFTTGQR